MAPVYLVRGLHRVSQMVAIATYPATCGVQVRRGERDHTFLSDWPHEAPFLQPLGKQAEALAVPVKNPQQSTAAAPKRKQMAGEGIEL
jgi:hypothetical protein